MIQETITTTGKNLSGISDGFSIRKQLLLIQRNWYIYILVLLVAGAGAYFYLEYTLPSYSVSTTILVEEEDPIPGGDLLEGFAVRPGVQNLDNQIMIVSSYTLMRKAVDALPFEIDVYRKGFRSEVSYYPLSPIRIEPGHRGLPYGEEFVFQHSYNDVFHLETVTGSIFKLDTLLSFGEEVHFNGRSFIIYPQPELQDIYSSGEKIYIRFYSKERLAEIYLGRLFVELATRDGSIVRLSLQGTNRIKDVILLNRLTEVYINDNLEKKNQEARRIIEFIDAQLGDVTDSLMITENQLQEFRSTNRIMDISAQAEQMIDQAVLLENENARLALQRNYYTYLEGYLSKEEIDQAPVSPSSMGIDDPLLTNLMQELAGLQAQYFSSGAGERNPLQGHLESRIRNTKQSIKETLMGIMQANDMAIEDNSQQISKLNSQASRLPAKERQLLGFERRFNLNNVLYTFLLQRRAEAQIQKASNTPDNVLIDPARSLGIVSPIGRNVFLLAFVLAIGLPTILILLLDIIRNKISCEEDLNMITQLPTIGHFPRSRLSYNTVVLTEPNSMIAEAFRSLRTRMVFFTKEVRCPVILVSSSMPGEGKTFAAINLASAYSLTGKRTLLIGFDLRRPTLSKSFELEDSIGVTNFLIGENSLDEVIHKTDFDNLEMIPSGPIPPNPGELSSSDKTKVMFSELRNRYDYIIVDSAPIGVVSDVYSVASISDVILLMVRHGHTKKNVLSATLAELHDNGISGLGLLVNDVKSKSSSYRYSYKYKYEYKSKSSKRAK